MVNTEQDLRNPVEKKTFPRLETFAETHASLSPDSIAIEYLGRRVTYSELHAEVLDFSLGIRKSGLAAGDVVAVIGTPSPSLVSLILACLRNGLVILPIDPNVPAARKLELCVQAGAVRQFYDEAIAVNEGISEKDLPGTTFAQSRIAAWKSSENDPLAAAGDEAFIVFTSGSTGKPKGIIGSHNGVVQFAHVQKGIFRTAPGHRIVLSTLLGGDPFFKELALSLVAGSVLVIPPARQRGELLGWIAEARVSLLQTVPSLLNQWLDSHTPKSGMPNSLRTVALAGEPLSSALVEKARRVLGNGVVFYNFYGPTETTITKSYYPIPESGMPDGILPLGIPLHGAQVFLVDSMLRSVRSGMIGEIAIRTPYRSNLYLDGRTGGFRPNPHSADPLDLIYLTGDLGRAGADGQLLFIGRKDEEVKILGNRIHPEEVRLKILSHSKVENAYVLAKEGEADGGPVLVAFYVGTADQDELAGFLHALLPPFMVPGILIPLETMPLLTNGKVDRELLKNMLWEIEPNGNTDAPETPLHETLCSLWEGATRKRKIGINQSFFQAGGHSLNLMLFCSAIGRHFGIDVGIREIYLNPTIKGIARIIEERQMDGAPSLGSSASGKSERAYPPDIPLSSSQERLLMLDRMSKAGAAYNMPIAFSVRGNVSVARAQAAFDALADLHPVLKTRLYELDGRPFQRTAGVSGVEVKYHDGGEDGLRKRRVEDTILEKSLIPFELQNAPLVRFEIFRVEDGSHVFFLNVHHIICDAWSMGLLLEDFARMWTHGADQGGDVASTRPSFYDFILDGLERSGAGFPQAAVDFWNSLLRDLPSPTTLFPDFPRIATFDYGGTSIRVAFGEAVSSGVRKFASERGTTVFVVLMAGFMALLHRLTGESDLVVGSDSSGRNDSEYLRTAGFFVNTVVYRADIGTEDTFDTLLGRVMRLNGDIRAFDTVDPYALYANGLLDLPESGDRPSLFAVMFRMFTGLLDLKSSLSSGLSVEEHFIPHPTSKFDLTLTMKDDGDLIRGELEYATAIFGNRSMEILFEQFETLVSGLVKSPGVPLASLPTRAHAGFSDPFPEPPVYPTAWALFEECSRNHPQLICVESGEERTTYAHMAEKVNLLAGRLSGLGASEGSIVAVYGSMSPDYIASFLATLKVGAVFFPLDSDLTPSRTAALIGDIQIACLLCVGAEPPFEIACPKLITRPGSTDIREVDGIFAGFRAPPGTATLFFTSGSTGRPKGIWGDAQALSHFILWERERLAVVPSDRFANLTKVGFDAILRDILTPLCSGACLVIPPGEVRESGSLTLDWLAEERISAFHSVPSLVDSWFMSEPDRPDPGMPRFLRLVAFSGEQLKRSLLDRLYAHILLPEARVFNFYGPSETLMIKSCYESADSSGPEILPLGDPLPFCHLHVLNNLLLPCDVGEIGEIHISTPFTVPCYVDAVTDADQRFVRDPFYPMDRPRYMYRTGDFARRNADGSLVFIGRRDDEVKVNGQRINLNSVAHAVEAFPGIGKCAVLVHSKESNRVEIAAFYVCAEGLDPAETEIRRFLQQTLPMAAVPGRLMRIEKLPLNANGKLDKKALKRTLADHGSLHYAEPPQDSTQQRVLAIWRKYLRRESLGIDENFFALGGHSLLATVIITQIRTAFGIHIPLAAFLDHPSIRGLSGAIDELLRESVENLSEEELLKLI